MESKRKEKWTIGRRSDLIFYCLMLALPVMQFCIFYIGVNFNSILLAFKKIEMTQNGYVSTFSFDNFIEVWHTITETTRVLNSTKISIGVYVLSIVINLPLGLLFSYYVAKKFPFSGFFRVMLYLPHILTSIVMIRLYMFFMDLSFPHLLEKLTGAEVMQFVSQGEPARKFVVVAAYNIWMAFGGSVLMYSNAMSGISPDVIEAANLDGAVGIKEFWHISLPLIFPILSVFLVTGIPGIFTNNFGMYSFYADSAPEELQTFGYYLYNLTKQAGSNKTELTYIAAFGLCMTIVAIPLTFGARYLFDKFGPSED